MHTVWNKRAETDLWLHIDYIHKQSPQNAKKVLDEIEQLVSKLKDFPYKYPKEPIYNNNEVRCAVLYSYKIVYKVELKNIRILRIFNAKQNPNKI